MLQITSWNQRNASPAVHVAGDSGGECPEHQVISTGNLLLSNLTPKSERKDWIGRARTLTSYISAA